jgi:hypothetical protein
MMMATMPGLKRNFFLPKRVVIPLLVSVLLVGVGGVLVWTTAQRMPVSETMNQPSADAAAFAPPLADANDTLLVWQGVGAAPGQHSASQPGSLSFMDGTGATTPIMELPQGASRVGLCGDQAYSPDGTMAALYIGQDNGTLYLMKGANAPVEVGQVSGLACLGGGTFQYSPDSNRLGYIAYEPGAAQSEFADGFLHIVNTGNLSEEMTAENVVAFDITNEGVAYISFFTNDKNEADEAAITWWSGTSKLEVATLQPNGAGCKFTSGQIAVGADGKYVAVLGHRCTTGDTRTAWQLYSIDPSERSATLAASDYQAGAFAAFARTNNIYLSPDGRNAYFTIADGITAHTVGFKMVGLTDMSISDVVERQAVMATYNGTPNASPQVSPDGRWLAFVVTSPNNTNTLTVMNLADSSVAPITLSAGSSGDTISSIAFTPDSSRLLLVAGGSNTANNSLVAVDLATGNDFRVSRGRFGRGLTISPDSSQVALLDWTVPEDPREPAYSNTVIIRIENSETTNLYTGAEIVEGKVTNQTFIAPLVWRRAGGEAVSG